VLIRSGAARGTSGNTLLHCQTTLAAACFVTVVIQAGDPSETRAAYHWFKAIGGELLCGHETAIKHPQAHRLMSYAAHEKPAQAAGSHTQCPHHNIT